MKRKRFLRMGIIVLALAIFLSVSMASAQYKDGVYMGVSDATKRGYMMAIVTIRGGAVADVRLTEMNGQSIPKDASYAWAEFHEAMAVLPGRFIAANSAQIDGVARATSTSNMAMQAVGRALDKAAIDKPAGNKYFDGTFQGREPGDERTGYAVAWVTIQNDRIVKVELEEVVPPNNTFKDWSTYPWQQAVEGKSIIEQRFVEANGTDVDLVTGATSSGEKYIRAVQAALRSAER